ncbi:unnamed protein product [Linum trigynum]|uniref:Transposase n=1 Tax=Linum trigynum TaxID=586398 RepID=A0AAV2CEV7_9ROSI
MQSMASDMLNKFEKYWGEPNMLISIAAIMDPRNKFKMLEVYFPDIYNGAEAVKGQIALVRDKLYQLFHEYVEEYKEKNMGNSIEDESGTLPSSTSVMSSTSSGTGMKRTGRAMFDSLIRNVDCVTTTLKSELDIYLEDGLYIDPDDCDLNVIEWWKEQRMRYKVLPRMACDVLAIPITSVASEAAFSAGVRVIDPNRASLGKKTVQALLCSQDWLRNYYGLKKNVKALTKKEEVVEVDLS